LANARGSEVIDWPYNHYKVGRNCWFNRDEVEYHLMFYGFWPSYTKWVYYTELFFMQSTSISHDARHNDSGVDARLVGNIDTNCLLNDIFGIYNEGNVENNDAYNTWNIRNPMFGLDDELIDCATLNNEENCEDAGYRRLLEQAEQELYPKSNDSKLSFISHLLHLKLMHGSPY